MSSGSTAQDPSWKSREQAEEASYIRRKEQEDLRQKLGVDETNNTERGVSLSDAADADDAKAAAPPARNRDEFEGGYGGQEDLEDRYATTYGAH